jgi:hypothetical protein
MNPASNSTTDTFPQKFVAHAHRHLGRESDEPSADGHLAAAQLVTMNVSGITASGGAVIPKSHR